MERATSRAWSRLSPSPRAMVAPGSAWDVAEVALANLVRSDANLHTVKFGQLRLMTFYLDG